MKKMGKNKNSQPTKAKKIDIQTAASEPMKVAKKNVMPLPPPPKAIGGNDMNWATGKQPKAVKSDRGDFGFK